jgi:methylphosphotriester-DNA--protein-cysteine methyltransferase
MGKIKPTKKQIVLSFKKAKPLRLLTDNEYMQGKFVGSNAKTRNGKKRSAFKFHRPTCDWAKKIKLGNLIEFDSHEEAVASGFKPCGTCRA